MYADSNSTINDISVQPVIQPVVKYNMQDYKITGVFGNAQRLNLKF